MSKGATDSTTIEVGDDFELHSADSKEYGRERNTSKDVEIPEVGSFGGGSINSSTTREENTPEFWWGFLLKLEWKILSLLKNFFFNFFGDRRIFF